jgi:hypothetical protein
MSFFRDRVREPPPAPFGRASNSNTRTCRPSDSSFARTSSDARNACQPSAGTVCQVTRSDGEIILFEDATRRDKSRLFVELTKDGLAELRREIAERSVPSKNSWLGVRRDSGRRPRRERAAVSHLRMSDVVSITPHRALAGYILIQQAQHFFSPRLCRTRRLEAVPFALFAATADFESSSDGGLQLEACSSYGARRSLSPP